MALGQQPLHALALCHDRRGDAAGAGSLIQRATPTNSRPRGRTSALTTGELEPHRCVLTAIGWHGGQCGDRDADQADQTEAVRMTLRSRYAPPRVTRQTYGDLAHRRRRSTLIGR